MKERKTSDLNEYGLSSLYVNIYNCFTNFNSSAALNPHTHFHIHTHTFTSTQIISSIRFRPSASMPGNNGPGLHGHLQQLCSHSSQLRSTPPSWMLNNSWARFFLFCFLIGEVERVHFYSGGESSCCISGLQTTRLPSAGSFGQCEEHRG